MEKITDSEILANPGSKCLVVVLVHFVCVTPLRTYGTRGSSSAHLRAALLLQMTETRLEFKCRLKAQGLRGLSLAWGQCVPWTRRDTGRVCAGQAGQVCCAGGGKGLLELSADLLSHAHV